VRHASRGVGVRCNGSRAQAIGIVLRQITPHAFAGFAETMKLPALPTSTLRSEFAMNAHALIDKDVLLR
jgi:hypothetical protein